MSGERIPSKSGVSLSERIAALQRKTSNPASPNYGNGSLSLNATASSSSSGRQGSSPSGNRAASSGARAVRDRIAKFQSSDERPVMPRSSFGSPVPNPEISHARRQFPGASAGKGSGAWGEGVLRPQMTGGVWLGAGAGGGWGDPSSASLRPQMTGGTNPTSRTQRGVSDNIVHGTGRDAFADLDDDTTIPTPLHLQTVSSGKQRAASESATSVQKDLPYLPDTPTAEIDTSKIDASFELPESVPEGPLPDFPSAPSDTPTAPNAIPTGLVRSDATPDTSVEIGVQVRSPGDFEKIRQQAEDLELADSDDTASDEPWLAPPMPDLAESVPEPLDASTIQAATQNFDSSASEQETWVQGYGMPSAAQDLASAEAIATRSASLAQPEHSFTADFNAAGTLPQRAQVARTESGRVDPNDPAAHEIQGPGLLVPRDEIAEARDLGANAVKAPLAEASHCTGASQDSVLDTKHETDTLVPTNASITALSPQTPPASDSSVTAASNTGGVQIEDGKKLALPAIARTKSQSQRLRRPPPGTMISAADLDASDDEYEPGWASVTSFMSSSRP